MSLLLVSKQGDASALMPRVRGSVFFTKARARESRMGKGLYPTHTSLKEALAGKPDAVLFDMVSSHIGLPRSDESATGPLADWIRTWLPVWGAGTLQDRLELDRAFGLSLMIQAGIRIPKTIVFDPHRGKDWKSIDLEEMGRVHRVKGGIKEAIEFVKETKKRWVLKPADNAAPSLSYVSRDPEDMIRRLQQAEESHEVTPDAQFLLQEFVAGAEVSTEAWVQQGEIVPGSWNGTIETKKFLAGDLGPNTGCQTSVVWPYLDESPKILRQTLLRPDLIAWLKKPTGPRGEMFAPYCGPLDLNCIISEDDHKPYGLEWTARFGYNAFWAYLELLVDRHDLADALIRVARGELDRLQSRNGYAYALRVTIPPYPHLDDLDPKKDDATLHRMLKLCEGVDILGPTDDPHVWLLDARKSDRGVETAGYDGVVMEITGVGQRIEEARDNVHALFKEFRIADGQARTADGADRAIKDRAKLEAWGLVGSGRPQG